METLVLIGLFLIPAVIFFLYLATIYQSARRKKPFLSAGIAGIVLIVAIVGTYKLTWNIAETLVRSSFYGDARRNLYPGLLQLQNDMRADKTEKVQAKLDYLVDRWYYVKFFGEDGGESLSQLTKALMTSPPTEALSNKENENTTAD